MSTKIRIVAIAGALTVALALPAAAHASRDLAINQVPSAKVVKPGQSVTFNITITNQGTEAYDDVFGKRLLAAWPWPGRR